MKYSRRYVQISGSVEIPWTGLSVKLYSDVASPVLKYTLIDGDSVGLYSLNSVDPGIYQLWDNTTGSLADTNIRIVLPSFGKDAGKIVEIATSLGTGKIVLTDGNGKLITETRLNAFNKNFGIGSTNVANGTHYHETVKLLGGDGGFINFYSSFIQKDTVIGQTYFDFGFTIPAGAKILGCQFRVDEEVEFEWTANWIDGIIGEICADQAILVNTKIEVLYDENAASAITTDFTDIRINFGGETPTEENQMTAIVYYCLITEMNNVGP